MKGGSCMQDFKNYDYTLTINQLEKAIKEQPDEILIIINGEYYTLVDEERKREKR